MPTVSSILQMRRGRREDIRRGLPRRFSRLGLGCGALLSLAIALVFTGLTIAYANLTGDLPHPEMLSVLLESPDGLLLQPTRLYDRSGEHVILTLENPASQPADEGSLPPALISATLATADPTFWTNPGFSWKGVRQNSHPTLAQRLVSDLLLWNEPPSTRRGLRERLLAAQITARFGREKVLSWYLKSADYGRLAYGAEAAASVYFGKSATDLTLAEAAILAAAAQAPALNPLDAPKIALERGNQVLQTMLGLGMIGADEFRQASAEKITFREAVKPQEVAPAFTQLVLEELDSRFGNGRVRRGGLRILTTLDYDWQLQAGCATDTQLSRLSGLSQEEIPAADGSPCLAARLLPTIPSSGQAEISEPAANLVVLDPATGQVLAMVGESSPGVDPAHLPGHPAGSLLNPLIYLTAFTRGLTPASLIWDIPGNPSEVTNPDGRFHGPMRLRSALANDYLVPAAQLLAQMGVDNVWRIARQLGVRSLEASEGTEGHLPFEGSLVTLLEVSQAYAVFAHQGLLVGQVGEATAAGDRLPPLRPVTVLRVEDALGKVWLACDNRPVGCPLATRPVLSTQLAYLMTNVLSDEPARWPSLGHPNPLEIGRPAGAKMGRTSDGGDAWTVGYTPQLVVGVWLGGGSPGTAIRVSPNSAAGLWHAVIQYASREQPVEDWMVPPGISTMTVCDPSGMLPTADCASRVSEVFLEGSEPTHRDTLFRTFQINRATGRLATVFTPRELIEERVYMIVPPEAAEWARDAGLPMPPEAYDLLLANVPMSENAQITAPAMFANVGGRVLIQGRAAGNQFDHYRLQVGQGLNPTTWLQVGEEVHKPVSNGELAVWDTSGLSGLYAVQLLVVDGERHVEVATIQVTVDNQPPQVSVRYPNEGQHFTYLRENTVTFQVEASDELNLEAVEFYLDDRLLLRLVAPPFAVTWGTRMGQHTLRVRAVDRAGNASTATLSFEVVR